MYTLARKVALLTTALCLLAVTPAFATTHYATPNGAALDDTGCPAVLPCSISEAVNSPLWATSGDEVVLAPGTYDFSTQLVITKGLDVHGTGDPAETVLTSNLTVPIEINHAGATLSRVTVNQTNPSNISGVNLAHGAIRNSIVDSQSGIGVNVLSGKITDTISIAHGNGSLGYGGGGIVSSYPTGGLSASLTLRNVTSIGKGSSYSHGLFIRCDSPGSVAVNARSSIFVGGPNANSYDIFGNNIEGTALVEAGNSNFSTFGSVNAGTVSFTSPTTNGNQTGEVTFVDAANDDYHLSRSTGYAIDLGILDGNSGAKDVDGENRLQGVAAEIGADEIDNVGPVAPTLGAPVSGSRIVFSGTSESLSIVHVTENGADVCTDTTPLIGVFTCVVSGVANGVHTYRAYAEDFLGNKSASSADVTATVNVDYDKPVLKKVSVKTKSRKTTVKFTANEAATFTCKLDKAKAKACKSPYKTKKLKKGKHKLVVTATDTAGLVGKPLAISWKVK